MVLGNEGDGFEIEKADKSYDEPYIRAMERVRETPSGQRIVFEGEEYL
jgi:hypothetical protein